MGMVVRTNTMSANAYRQLGMNNGAVAKSLEKLSSGFRINRAGDDASGLAISEKMKAQIKGLEQASANSQDGISLVQTAEGALTEVHGMLNRMVELATKSANGTIQDKVDREAIQTEVNALNTEITRISKSTNFNGINLLDGSLSANSSKATVTDMGATLGKGFGTTGTALAGKTALTASVVKDWSGITTSTAGTFTFETGSYDTAGKFVTGTGATADTVRVKIEGTDGNVTTLEAKWSDVYTNTTGTIGGTAVTSGQDMVANHTANINLASFGLGSINLVGNAGASRSELMAVVNNTVVKTTAGAAANTGTGGLTLQVGDTNDTF
ncbi:MAG: flagellin, partial [Oscillospiraceae bacterium]